MTALRKNIERYKQQKGIKKDSDLLRNIARELGVEKGRIYEFVNKEKANFSKMLNGTRPLKHEFIIPLEKIFGVSLARLLDEDAYKLPVEKCNVPYDKGFRYYAYSDDPELYKTSFDNISAKDGKSILNNTDEFGKTFLDYVVEYRAVNGVRYLHDEYGITLKWWHNNFEFKKEKGAIWCDFDNAIGFARLVASMNDADLFNDIFDSYNMFYSNGHYGDESISIFYNPDYLEILMDNQNIFNSLFECKKYNLKLGSISQRKCKTDMLTYRSINPILNNCLKYALRHLDKYKKQAIRILEFGVTYNMKLAGKMNKGDYDFCNELGRIENSRDDKFYECAIVVDDIDCKDDDIKKLIGELPKFYDFRQTR